MNAVMLPPDQLSHELRTEATADLRRRRWIIELSFAGALIGKVAGTYHTGMVKRLPDILPSEAIGGRPRLRAAAA